MNHRWHIGLRGKLLALIMITFLPAITLSGYNALRQLNAQEAASIAQLMQTARLIKMSERYALNEATEFLQALASTPALMGGEPRNVGECKNMLDRIAAHFHTYLGFGVAASDGAVFCASSRGNLPDSVAERAFFQDALARRRVAFGPYEYDSRTRRQQLFLGAPVDPMPGKGARVVFAVLDLSQMQNMPLAAQLTPDSVVKLFDQSGLVLERMPDLMGVSGSRMPAMPLLARVRTLAGDAVVYAESTDRVARLYATTVIHQIPSQTVYLAVGLSPEAAFGAARRTFYTQMAAMAALSCVMLASIWFGSNVLVLRKMQRVVAAADRIRAGDVDARCGLRGDSRGGDEFARLGGAVDAMAAALKQRLDALHWHDTEMRQVMEMNEAMQACLNQDELLAVVRLYVGRLFPLHAVALYLMHEGGDSLEEKLAWNQPASAKEFLIDDCWAMRRGQAYLVERIDGMPGCKHVVAPLPVSYLCLPLMAHGQVLGLLHLQDAHFPKLDSEPESQQLGRSVAHHITLVLVNLRLQAMLRMQATRDALTGLFNRRFMEETLRRETRNADRYHNSIGILMIDLDHFKDFNDRFGHAAGDAVLRDTARLLEHQMRGGDLACRFGGEEFVVILPCTDLAHAGLVAQTLCETVRANPLAFQGKAIGPVTVSVGVACYPQHGKSWEQVLHVADIALLRAKQERDRVVVYDGNAAPAALPAP
jgi:diguanylate cyclase (GGDEF)-like protein